MRKITQRKQYSIRHTIVKTLPCLQYSNSDCSKHPASTRAQNPDPARYEIAFRNALAHIVALFTNTITLDILQPFPSSQNPPLKGVPKAGDVSNCDNQQIKKYQALSGMGKNQQAGSSAQRSPGNRYLIQCWKCVNAALPGYLSIG